MNVGKKIRGVTILPGDEILKEYKREKFSIVISSLIYETPIRNRLEQIFKGSDEVVPDILGFSNLLKQS